MDSVNILPERDRNRSSFLATTSTMKLFAALMFITVLPKTKGHQPFYLFATPRPTENKAVLFPAVQVVTTYDPFYQSNLELRLIDGPTYNSLPKFYLREGRLVVEAMDHRLGLLTSVDDMSPRLILPSVP